MDLGDVGAIDHVGDLKIVIININPSTFLGCLLKCSY